MAAIYILVVFKKNRGGLKKKSVANRVYFDERLLEKNSFALKKKNRNSFEKDPFERFTSILD